MNDIATKTNAMPAVADEGASLLAIIAKAASDPNVDIEKMDRLLQMQERWETRHASVEFAAAFADMQTELPEIKRQGRIVVRKKDAAGERTGDVQQDTPYALWEDINEAIKPVLFKYGFGLSFRVGQTAEGKVTVTGILRHRAGHSEETTMTLMQDSTGSKNAVQAIGSSVSYGKRYAAAALLNLTSRGEDDDGKAAGDDEVISDEQRQTILKMLDETNSDIAAFCAYLKIDSIPAMPAKMFERAVKAIEAKQKK